MSFSIDDVRETFARDIAGFIGGIRDIALPLSMTPPPVPLAESPFLRLGDGFHTVYGTTMLVGATSLADTAAQLEALCRRAEQAAVAARQQEENARRVAGLCFEAAEALAGMLELELNDRRGDALAKASEFRAGRISEVVQQLDAEPAARAPTGEDSGEFAFEDDQPLLGAEQAELLAIFRAETSAAAAQLEQWLDRLAQAADDFATAGSVERCFHTLKGASASVRLTQVSDLAARLQQRMIRVLESEQSADGDFLRALVADTNRLLALAGLGPIAPAHVRAQAFGSDSVDFTPIRNVEFSFVEEPEDNQQTELLEIFKEETRELAVLLRGHVDALLANPSDLGAVAQMERTFHTLKGSAATVGSKELSGAAGRVQTQLQGVLESSTAIERGFLDQLFASINHFLVAAGLSEIVISHSSAQQAGVGDAPRQLFLEEARQICGSARDISAELPRVPLERARALRSELARLFHRLKGSALLSTDPRVAEEAERLQRLAEGNSALSGLELTQGIARIAATLGFDLDAATDLSPGKSRTKAELVREPVKLTAEPELFATVLQECAELLDAIDRLALDLESNEQPKLALKELFRLYHTLKGAVNTAGLTPTGQELHLIEDFLETLRDRPVLPAMRGVATLLLEVQGDVRRQLRQSAQGFVEISLPRVRAAIAAAGSGGWVHSESTSKGQSQSGPSASADHGSMQEAPEHSSRKYIRVGTERLDALMNLAGELVVSRSRLMSRVVLLRVVQQGLSLSSRRLVETVDRFRDEHEFSRVENGGLAHAQNFALRAPTPALPDSMQAASPWASFSELELDRYDDVNVLSRSLAEITNDVSEMNAELVRELSGFADDSDAFSSLVSGIQTEVTRARMIQLEFLFTRIRLPARDAAEREGKEVRVVTRGEEVSLDKTIADALFAPMLHLVRNAVVHGVESPAVRAAAGKAALGVITLGAREEAGQIVIEVQDDGAGLDLAALRARGVAMGLVSEDTPLTDPAIKDLVFASGLSTRATAGDVSGRGIGGDVIRRAIERMNGSIRVDSEPGKGTAFTMSLPVTLSITRALLIQHRGRTLAVPLHFSERIIDAQEVSIIETAGTRRVRLDDVYLPVRTLDEVFKATHTDTKAGPLLILRMGRQRICMQVEKVSSQEEIVVKSMGDLLTGHPLFAGATIRGNGELVLILDVPALIEGRTATGRAIAPGEALAFPDLSDSLGNGSGEHAPMLPGKAPAALPGAARSSAAFTAHAQRPARLRVLFVDDSLSVRRVAEKALHSLGAEVTLAVDGVDALAKLQEATFDIVFTDLEMPRTHGYDLIRELRFIPAYKNLPIVVVSSRSGKKHQDQARALGANEYMTKPFSAKGLESALTRWCSGARDARTFHENPESV